MRNNEMIRLINQSIADTNYIKDNKVSCYHLKKILQNWIVIYMISNLILFLIQSIGTIYDLLDQNWFFPLKRILYIALFLFAFLYCIFLTSKTKMSVKENDFMKLYIIIPMLLVFTKVIFPISYYLNTDIFLGLLNTVSLDLITLILSSLLMKYYFKDSHLNIFILYNTLIYLLNIVVIYLFSTLNSSPSFLINTYNLIIFLKDYGLFTLFHFIFLFVYMKKFVKNEEIYI